MSSISIDLNYIENCKEQNKKEAVNEVSSEGTSASSLPKGFKYEEDNNFTSPNLRITSFVDFKTSEPVDELKTYWHLICPDLGMSYEEFKKKHGNLSLLFDYGHWLEVNEPNYASLNLFVEKSGITSCKEKAADVYKLFQHLHSKYFAAELREQAIELQLFLWVTVLELFVEHSQNEFEFFCDWVEASHNEKHLELIGLGVKVFAGLEAEDRNKYLARLRTVFINRINEMKGTLK